MKVYVEKLPNMCEDCDCLYYDDYAECYKCPLMLDNEVKYWAICRDKDCPLQSIADHDKQVRKEVVQEIREKLKPKEIFHPEDEFEVDYDFYYKEDVEQILEQIQNIK